jgi:hypothetical protein
MGVEVETGVTEAAAATGSTAASVFSVTMIAGVGMEQPTRATTTNGIQSRLRRAPETTDCFRPVLILSHPFE